jgi:two-component system CheB/CheR fusion protein
VYDRLLDRFIPPSVLVNQRREVVHVFGSANNYLRLAAGRASLDVVSMCEGELRVALSSALLAAAKRRTLVATHNVRVGEGEAAVRVDVSV